MKIIKSFFQIDYQLSYALIDRMGELADIIHQAALKSNIELELNINSNPHFIVARGLKTTPLFSINIQYNLLRGFVEFPKGVEIERVSETLWVDLAQKVIDNLQIKNIDTFNRIGFRNYVLSVGNNNIKFDALLNKIIEQNSTFSDSIKSIYPLSDAGLTFESMQSDEKNLRVILGPYHKREADKYFDLPENKDLVDEGFIMDIDLWKLRYKIPKFNLKANLENWQKQIKQIADAFEKKLDNVC